GPAANKLDDGAPGRPGRSPLSRARCPMRATLSAAVFLVLAWSAPGRSDETPDVRKVIDKAIKAQGGADKLERFKAVTFKLKGKVYGMSEAGIPYSGEWTVGPNRLRADMTVEVMGTSFPIVRIVDGDKGWMRVMDRTTELDKDQLAEARETFY